MNNKIILTQFSVENDELHFTLTNINISFANALRRVMLTEIPSVVIRTENAMVNQCAIETNTSRLNNETIKQRLSCIPIHMKVPMKKNWDENDVPLLKNYQLEVDIKNDTKETLHITTEHFKIKNKNNEHYLTENEMKNIFPPNKITGNYILFLRLNPIFCDNIPGEQFKMTAEFSIATSKINSMFCQVSTCTSYPTPDVKRAKEKWESLEKKMMEENTSKEKMDFLKRDFMSLDAEQIYLKDSFNFIVKSIGVYDDIEIVKYACFVLQQKFLDFIDLLESDQVPILNSETTMENCFDVILVNEDDTLGRVLQYILYENYYLAKEPSLSFCGFKKFHPHDEKCTVRVSFYIPTNKNIVREYLKNASNVAIEVFEHIFKLF